MPDYQQSKIYRIINDELPDLVYYGSTVQKLCYRMSHHRRKCNTCASAQLFTKGKAKIVLVENFPCECKEELLQRERYYIENNKCVNKIRPITSHAEMLERKKQHRLENPEQYKNKDADHYERNQEQILLQKKEYYKKNKEKILLQKRQYRAKKKLENNI